MQLMNIYALNNTSIKDTYVFNAFTEFMSKVAHRSGEMLMPFTMGSIINLNDYENKVQDLTKFTGISDEVKGMQNKLSIWEEIAWYNYSIQTHKWGRQIAYTEDVQRTMYLDYLLTSAMCYVEYPKVKNKKGDSVVKYEKGIFTRNTGLISKWLGETDPNDIAFTNAKYISALTMTPSDYAEGNIKMVQLKESKGKRTVAKAPITINQKGISPMPMFMLNDFINGIWGKLKTGILKFSYIKDNISVREMYSTVNPKVLDDYYGTDANSKAFVDTMLANTDAEFSTDILPKYNLNRGYIRLPELGISRYDATGCRALNLNRILKIEEVEVAPKDFIDVDLDAVEEIFNNHILRLVVKSDITNLLQIYNDLVGEPIEDWVKTSAVFISEQIVNKVKSCIITLTTTYKRELHLYMINRPHIFQNYTGRREDNTATTDNSDTSYGIATMDF